MPTREDIYDALGDGEGAYWLLDLDFQGRTYHITDAPGGAVIDGKTYEPGLQTFEHVDSGDLQAITVEIDIGEDWAGLVAEGFPLDWATGTIRRWWHGQTLAEAEVVLSGVAMDPEYGAADEPLTLTIEPETAREGTMLDPLAVADQTAWPEQEVEIHGAPHMASIPDRSIGRTYPLVIGIPGQPEPGRGRAYPAVPVVLARYAATEDRPPEVWEGTTIVLGVGRMAAHEARIWLFDRDEERHENLPTIVAQDEAGTRITMVTLEADHALRPFGPSVELWAGYGSNILGGILGRDGQMLRGAGDVLEWALVDVGGFRVDHGSLAAAKPVLNRYMVDTYIDDSKVGVWEWVERELLKLLPVVVMDSAQGLAVKVIRWDASEARLHSVAHLDATPGSGPVHRVSSITSLRDELRNRFEVRYRGARGGQQWISRVVVDAPGGPRDGDARVLLDSRCQVSQARYGVLPYSVDASWVWDDATADRIARDLAARMALPLRQVTYACGWEQDVVEPWDVVTITDPEVSLDNVVAYVASKKVTAEGIDLTLILLPT